ncbi:hypothetical protein ABT040_40060 [Streptomyces sp. NPDC002688]|uniref:hypothetical protein n=1 Tax=Streptomyces sp. NPDC002688 TaxID=3154423 RepID=UPI003323E556
MLTVLTELGKKISERWLSLLVVPGFLFVCAVANAAWLGHGHALETDLLVNRSAVAAHGLEHRPAKVAVFAVLLLLAATGAGIVAAGAAGVVNRVWLDQVRLPLSWLDRRDRLQRLRSRLVAWRRRRDERVGRPGRPPQYLPARVTWIGDRVRLTDERVRYQYGMHVALVWPRLWLVTSDAVREHVQAAYDRYTAATGLAGWAFLYLSLGLRWWPAAVVGVIAGGVAWRRARTAIEAFCLLAEAAIDTHQQQLATSLGITLADGRIRHKEGNAIDDLLNKNG